MAQAYIVQSSLRLTFFVGIDQYGKEMFKTRTYSNLNSAATAEQVYQAAQALASLSKDPLHTIERNDRSAIYAE
mgnify:CR=1 FL=1